MQRRALWIRIIYALCLAGATINHVRAVIERGWIPEQLPPATAVYWAGLTFADPLAVLLLFLRPRAGIALTGIIILSNVAHNLWFLAAHPLKPSLGEDVIASPFMLSQIAFLLFVMATAPIAWRGSPRRHPAG